MENSDLCCILVVVKITALAPFFSYFIQFLLVSLVILKF